MIDFKINKDFAHIIKFNFLMYFISLDGEPLWCEQESHLPLLRIVARGDSKRGEKSESTSLTIRTST